VKYIISNGLCTDTITKIIPIGITPADIILTPDTTICFNSTALLRTINALDFCWSPISFLNDPTLANPTTSTAQPITYYFTAAIEGSNLVTNPAFTLGNNSFTTQYTPINTNTAPGQYFVGNSTTAWNVALSNCTDHTSGNGNMLIVNSDAVTNANVWLQNIAVSPNTNYSFSTWIQSLSTLNPAQLNFTINGNEIGNPFIADTTTCNWQQFFTTWNSGNNSMVTLSIINKNTQTPGSYFAVDDISFAPVTIQIDSVQIRIDTPVINTIADTASCRGVQIQLSTTGGATYQWQPTVGLSDATAANPIAAPADTTQYFVTGTTIHNCTARDSVTIAIKPSPQIQKTADTSICKNAAVQLLVSGGDTYQWRTDTTLSSDTIANPIATPIRNTTYYVQTTTAGFVCTSTDSIRVSIKSAAGFAISPNDTICAKSNVQLTTTGGNIFNWQPANLLNDASLANPIATPSATTIFSVNIKDSVCGDTATLRTTIVTIPLPVITATKSNDIDCFYLNAQLNVTGGNSAYAWTAAEKPLYLSDTSIANPVAFPSTTKLYFVTGSDTVTQCKNTDSIYVLVYLSGNPVFWAPNAFSPNGDAHNNCYSVKAAPGKIKYFEMHIYNRWGNEVFKTENINDCWDGTYKGQPQDPGNFVVYIRARNECKEDITKGNLLLIR
jgi:gliding motility-associated-like protein